MRNSDKSAWYHRNSHNPVRTNRSGGFCMKLEIKSKLSQYLSIANMCSNGYIKELELVVHEKEDMDRLIEFMLSGENPK